MLGEHLTVHEYQLLLLVTPINNTNNQHNFLLLEQFFFFVFIYWFLFSRISLPLYVRRSLLYGRAPMLHGNL